MQPAGTNHTLSDTNTIHDLINKSNAFSQRNMRDSAIYTSKKAFVVAQTLGDDLFLAKTSFQIADDYKDADNDDNQRYYLNLSLRYWAKINAPYHVDSMAMVNYELARLSFKEHKTQEAIIFSHRSDSLAILADDSDLIYRDNQLLGTCYMRLKEYRKATGYINLCFSHAANSADISNTFRHAVELMAANKKLKNDHLARFYQAKALFYAYRLSDPSIALNTITTMVEDELDQRNYDVARLYLEEGENIIKKDVKATIPGSLRRNLVRLYFETGDYKNAQKECGQFIKYSNEAHAQTNLLEAMNWQYKIDSAQGNYKSAFQNYQKWEEQYKILYNIDSIYSDVKRLNEQKEKLIEENNKKITEFNNKLAQEKIGRYKQRNTLSAIVISILLFLISLSIIYSRSRKKMLDKIQKSKEIADRQNSELQINLNEIDALRELLENDLDHYRELTARRLMNPHFLFNSLNAIQYFYLHNEVLAANTFLSDFAMLIRKNLEYSRKEFISINEELETIVLYVELEMLRFKNKFDCVIETEEVLKQNLNTFKIPPMLIQPYVENAILHGINPLKQKGLIKIILTKIDDHIICVVEDNGVGFKQSLKAKLSVQSDHQSIGNQVTEERIKILRQLTKLDFEVKMEEITGADGSIAGTRVWLKLPLI